MTLIDEVKNVTSTFSLSAENSGKNHWDGVDGKMISQTELKVMKSCWDFLMEK